MRKVCLIAVMLISAIVCAQQRRVALLIGNEEYNGHFSRLYTPVNDTKAMANVLYKMGYDTIVANNVPRASMSYYFDKFKKRANGSDIALFYYSGHGGIDKEQFYLAPSGEYKSLATLTSECYPFTTVERELRGIHAPTRIFIIDACRNSIDDNKAKMSSYYSNNINNSIERTKGTIYLFATGVNKVAHQTTKYSLFTESLLNHIGDVDNLEIVWKKISQEVTMKDPEQVPYYYDENEIINKVYLNPDKISIYSINREGQDYYTFYTTPSDAVITIGKSTPPRKNSIFRDDNTTSESEITKLNSGGRVILKYGQEYDVKISAAGYKTNEEKITATPYKTNYNYSLYKYAKSSLTIQCNKDKSSVYLDDKYIGYAPIYSYDTNEGPHKLRVERRGYYDHNEIHTLKSGSQSVYVSLRRKYPSFLKWDEDPCHNISYYGVFKYPLCFGYMYRPDYTRFSFGAILGVSFGFFRGWSLSPILKQSQTATITIDTNTSTNTGSSTTITQPSTINGAECSYSSFIDPYNEAKHYDASLLLLGNVGFNVTNGILLEAGIGAGHHRDLYHMDHTYILEKQVTTNTLTGEVSETPYEYKQQDESHWYKENSKWSPAIRLGTKFFIPVYFDERFISVGFGYTYLPSNHKFSSFDLNIGFSWEP